MNLFSVYEKYTIQKPRLANDVDEVTMAKWSSIQMRVESQELVPSE